MTPLKNSSSTSAAAPALKIENLHFRYHPDAADVLSIQSLKIATGERVFMYGPSGCGKTTFLGCIAGILQPTADSLNVLGENLTELPNGARDRWRGKNVGYIFQMLNLLPYLTAKENILLPARLNSLNVDESDLMLIAKKLGIEQILARPATDLSVGQQQRVAAARSMILKPKLLIADEPTSALDANTRDGFLNLLLDQCQDLQTTVIFVSHDRNLKSHFNREISLPEINTASHRAEGAANV